MLCEIYLNEKERKQKTQKSGSGDWLGCYWSSSGQGLDCGDGEREKQISMINWS